jgi:hypothetical protein
LVKTQINERRARRENAGTGPRSYRNQIESSERQLRSLVLGAAAVV